MIEIKFCLTCIELFGQVVPRGPADVQHHRDLYPDHIFDGDEGTDHKRKTK